MPNIFPCLEDAKGKTAPVQIQGLSLMRLSSLNLLCFALSVFQQKLEFTSGATETRMELTGGALSLCGQHKVQPLINYLQV